MVQSLLTLQVVPVASATLARTELVPAVRALRKHQCERVVPWRATSSAAGERRARATSSRSEPAPASSRRQKERSEDKPGERQGRRKEKGKGEGGGMA
jgi:hypothetical protein